ncbi:MAG: class I SAM-dependent methyltransferase [Thermoleophilaceae bacterium]
MTLRTAAQKAVAAGRLFGAIARAFAAIVPAVLGRSRAARRAWIERLRPVWLEVVRPFDKGLESAFEAPLPLESRHVTNCRVLPDREALAREVLKKDAVAAELGTLRGRFARTLLDASEPRELHLIDIDMRRLERDLLAPGFESGRVIAHEGDSVAILSSFPDAYFDWIYIDADHSYAGVKRDIAVAKQKVKPDGMLVFNDYTVWSPLELEEYGVVRAVNELCRDDGWELRYLALQRFMYCDVAVSRIQTQ